MYKNVYNENQHENKQNSGMLLAAGATFCAVAYLIFYYAWKNHKSAEITKSKAKVFT
jgi:hypothetical protein